MKCTVVLHLLHVYELKYREQINNLILTYTDLAIIPIIFLGVLKVLS